MKMNLKHLKYLAALALVPLAATGCVEASGSSAKTAKTTTTATTASERLGPPEPEQLKHTDDTPTVTASAVVDVMGTRAVTKFCGLYDKLQIIGPTIGYTPAEVNNAAYRSFKHGYGDGGGSGVSARSVFDELLSRCS